LFFFFFRSLPLERSSETSALLPRRLEAVEFDVRISFWFLPSLWAITIFAALLSSFFLLKDLRCISAFWRDYSALPFPYVRDDADLRPLSAIRFVSPQRQPIEIGVPRIHECLPLFSLVDLEAPHCTSVPH